MAETPHRRRQAPFFLGLVVILAALPLGYFLFLHQPPPPPLPPPPPPPPVVEAPPREPMQLELREVSGTVEVRRASGDWVKAQPGERLQASDAVRTRDGSYAVIIGGEAVEVRMEPGTEVSVDELTDELSRLLLGNGMATTTLRPGKWHTIEGKAGGRDAVARATEGAFTMSNDGAGTVAVGTREGEVSFSGNGKVVIVRAGQVSVVRPGGSGPSEPTPVPSSLLRKVKWPGNDGTLKQREIVVQGQAEPGSRLELAGQSFFPDKDGNFKRAVSLKEGENQVTIKALSVGGARDEASRKFDVDTLAPDIKSIKTPWGNSGGQKQP
jgi:hypothetical protein